MAHQDARVRILLADDQVFFRQALRTRLDQEPDLEVVAEAGDGAQAIRLSDEFQPDIILMDVMMPNVNGIDATKAIIDRAPGVRVIALSLHADDAFVDLMLQAGARLYLRKDSDWNELPEKIRLVACR